MLTCVACFGWTGKYKVFPPLILTEPPSKLLNWSAEKHFLSKYQFAIFTNKIIRSTLTLYLANQDIDVITDVITNVAQQGKPKFSHLCKILTELRNSPSKNIPFFQNAAWFTISHEHSNSLHLNFIYKLQTWASILYRHHPNFRVANF